MNLHLAASAEPTVGWGHPLALILTALAFWAFTSGYKRYQEVRKTTSDKTTSAPAAVTVNTVNTVKPQLTAPADSGNTGGMVTTAVVVRPTPAVAKPAPIDEFVNQRLGHMSTTQIVRDAKRVLNVSDATAWRAIRKARKEKP